MTANKNSKKVVKKVTKKAVVAKKANTVTITKAQANTIIAALGKAGKTYKFLNNKVAALAV